jgi:hypothetical protein
MNSESYDRQMTAEVAETIERAADLIETGGLTKGEYSNSQGAHCLLGALGTVASTVFEYGRATEEVARRIAGAEGYNPEWGFAYIVGYNDEPTRTQSEVVDMLKTIAKDIRNDL